MAGKPSVTGIAIIVPTTGRLSLAFTLASLAQETQKEDRVLVMCDDPLQYDSAEGCVDSFRSQGVKGCWRCYDSEQPLGHYGHPQRNLALDLLAELEDAPAWAWSIDDDDIAKLGAVDMIRAVAASNSAPWYVFRMVGGDNSHFPGVTVPTMGQVIEPGNVGTPMLVFPVDCDARFGLSVYRNMPPGYFGDAEMAEGLLGVLDEPGWRDEIVAEIRPAVSA